MNFKYTPGSTKKYNMFLVTRSFAKQLQLRLYIAGLDLPWHIGTVPGASRSGGRRYRALRLDGNCRRNLAKTFSISFLFVSHIWQENAAKIWLFLVSTFIWPKMRQKSGKDLLASEVSSFQS